MREKPYRLGLLCTDGMSLLSLTLCMECLRISNRVLGANRFAWRLYSETGDPVTTSGQLRIETDAALPPDALPDLCIVLASYGAAAAATPRTLGWLRRLQAQNVRLGCVDSGGILLAQAGVLGDQRISMHHELAGSFFEHWPRNCDPDAPFRLGPRLISSGGGVDTIDMMLALIAEIAGDRIADKTAIIMRYERHAQPADFNWTIGHLGTISLNPELRAAVEYMNNHLENPVTLAQVCAGVGVSAQRLRRIFRNFLGATPGRYYLDLRLERASQLLKWSNLKLMDIAAACGFSDSAAFSNAYRRHRGRSPKQERRLYLDAESKPESGGETAATPR